MKFIKSTIRPTDWQVVYIALMTILMILFMILYAYYEKIHSDKENARLDKQIDLAMIINEDIQSNQMLRNEANVKISRNRIRVTLPSSIIFALGSAKLNKNAMRVLEKLSDRLNQLSEEKRIVIEGHTDNIPIRPGGRYKTNWELSVHRALSVLHLFIKEGMTPKRLVSIGYGKYKPLYPNNTMENRASNRRIEISIMNR